MSEVVCHAVALDNGGEIVIPREFRDRHGWDVGTPLITVDADPGVIVTSTDEALDWLQSRWDKRDLVAELLEERRAEVEREGAYVCGL